MTKSFCIFCYNKKGLKPITDIFSSQDNTHSYLDAIFKCFNIQFLDKHFNCVNNICKKCIARLKYCYAFRQEIEAAHQKLYNIFIQQKINNINVSIDGLKTEPNNLLQNDTVKQPSYEIEKTLKREEHTDNEWNYEDEIKESTSYDQKEEPYDSDWNYEDEIKESTSYDQKEEPYDSDWSVNTDDVLRATGFWKEMETIKNKKRFVIPPLDENTRQCPDCFITFTSRSNLLNHYPKHYPNLLCDVCGKSYASLSALQVHMLRHKNIKFKCIKCDKLFATHRDMRVHNQRVHEGKYKFKCRLCGKQFRQSESRRTHLIQDHNIQTARKQCQMCDYYITSTGDLRKHIKENHFDECQFKCIECSTIFLSRHEKKEHMAKHLDEKEYCCEFCDKRFARSFTLKEHRKIHLNIKKYVCNECNKAFVQKAALNSHIKIHFKQ